MIDFVVSLVTAGLAIYKTWNEAGEEDKAKIEKDAQACLDSVKQVAASYAAEHQSRTDETFKEITDAEKAFAKTIAAEGYDDDKTKS